MMRDPLFLVAANLLAAVLLRCLRPNLFSAFVLAIVLIASTGYMGSHHGKQITRAIYYCRDQLLTASGKPITWPAEKMRAYPDLQLLDQDGNLTRLSDFK